MSEWELNAEAFHFSSEDFMTVTMMLAIRGILDRTNDFSIGDTIEINQKPNGIPIKPKRGIIKSINVDGLKVYTTQEGNFMPDLYSVRSCRMVLTETINGTFEG